MPCERFSSAVLRENRLMALDFLYSPVVASPRAVSCREIIFCFFFFASLRSLLYLAGLVSL